MADAITLRDGHAAVCVKVYHLDSGNAADDVAERAYNMTVELFWDEATRLAHKRGYAAVFAEGRSDGWCVPFYQRAKNGRTQFDNWPGSGPDHGYPRYPDVEHNGAEREKFRAFQRDIRRLLADVQAHYTANIAQVLEVS